MNFKNACVGIAAITGHETCLAEISSSPWNSLQLTYRESLRAIENPDFAQTLIAIARPLHAHDPIGVELNQSLHALD